MAEIEKRKIRIISVGYPEVAEISFDRDALKELIKECVAAVSKSHQDFPYSPNAFDFTIYNRWLHILVINELIKQPNLDVDIYGEDISDICKLESMELLEDTFPNDLSDNERLEVQKHIVTKLGEAYKEAYK